MSDVTDRSNEWRSGPSALPADYWEASYRTAAPGRLWPTESTITGLDLDEFRRRKIDLVLDAGCGDGKNLVYLAGKGFTTIGVDAAESALVQCRQLIERLDLSHRALLVGPCPLERMPFFQSTIGGAICIDVLGHQPSPELFLQELSRVLRPGGMLYASVFHWDDGCRTGPRMREGEGKGAYWYHAGESASKAPRREYYFRFYDEADARRLFEACDFGIADLCSRTWREPPHPGYRDEEHEHVSWFALLKRL
jgi:SAM-dependent methyltransferase